MHPVRKVIFIGEAGVGKSCLFQRITKGEFVAKYVPTIGVDFGRKDVRDLTLQLWDTAGQERLRSISKAYFRGAHAYVLVYDVTNSSSFEKIPEWLSSAPDEGELVKFLVANKCDVPESEQQVSVTQAEEWCRQNDIIHHRVSARSGQGVDELMERLVDELSRCLGSNACRRPGHELLRADLVFPGSELDRTACTTLPPFTRTACKSLPPTRPTSLCGGGSCSLMSPLSDADIDRLYAKCDYGDISLPQRSRSVIASSIPANLKMQLSTDSSTLLAVGDTKFRVGVDLISASKAYLRFLDSIECEFGDQLLVANTDSLRLAFSRYAKFLRLVALYPDRKLYAPPDIELLWKTHLIRPTNYQREIRQLFGRVIDHSEMTQRDGAAEDAALIRSTERLWRRHYVAEEEDDDDEKEDNGFVPLWLLKMADRSATAQRIASALASENEGEDEDDDGEAAVKAGLAKVPSWSDVAAVVSITQTDLEKDARWLPLMRGFVNKQTTQDVCEDASLLAKCVDGYGEFLGQYRAAYQAKAEMGLEPTYDVDLMWHAHMMHPLTYQRDCEALGLGLDHLPWPYL